MVLFYIKISFPVVCTYFSLIQNTCQINGFSFPIINFFRSEFLNVTNHFLNRFNSNFSHPFSKVLGYKTHKVLNILRLSGKFLSKRGILSSHTNRTCIQVTNSHHNTAHSYKRPRSETKFLSAQKSGDSDITTCKKLSVSLNNDPVSQIIHKKSLMGFSHTQFPWKSGVTHTCPRSGSRTPVITTYKNNISPAFSDADGNSPDSRLRNKLNAYSGVPVSVFKVVNKLSQILNRIYIMMRRRRDKTNPRS